MRTRATDEMTLLLSTMPSTTWTRTEGQTKARRTKSGLAMSPRSRSLVVAGRRRHRLHQHLHSLGR